MNGDEDNDNDEEKNDDDDSKRCLLRVRTTSEQGARTSCFSFYQDTPQDGVYLL